ncbi:probable cytochrome P450 305a1 [Epargyreus clarus]|uniref:probable cytochrome P450 305a1 n=1 Tax=Epargyreus clarus TaxID=520877 RepID=UPI003C2F3942
MNTGIQTTQHYIQSRAGRQRINTRGFLIYVTCNSRALFRNKMFLKLIAVALIVCLGYIIRSMNKPKKFPPGPKWYPVLGCSTLVQNLSKKLGSQTKAFKYLSEEYATDVLGLKLGSDLLVVVYGEKNIRQVFTEKEFEGRPNSFFIRLRCLGKRMGITFTDGPVWKEHRQFTVKQLKNVGFGKTTMEKEIQYEMISILQYIKENNNKPINPKNILAMSVMNILWRYMAGERIEEKRLKFLLDLLDRRSKAFTIAGGWLNTFPWIRFIFPETSGYSLINKMNQQLSDIIEEAIEKHKSKEIKDKDYIYSFLEEMNERKNTFTEDQLKIICLDVLIAGGQTTSNLMDFAVLAALRHPDVQEKLYREINEVLGDDVPCWADTSRLHYMSAFLLEVHRYYTIVPLTGPRRVLWETTIDGYVIPKDATVLMGVGDLHNDPEYWDEPNKFKPERFIDEKGLMKNPEHMYPFGLGRRRCPGDALAKSFIFITFVGIIQKFKIQCSNGILPPKEPIVGLIAGAKPYTAEFLTRA